MPGPRKPLKKSKKNAAACAQREEADASLLTPNEVVLGTMQLSTPPSPFGVEVEGSVLDQDPVQKKVTKAKTHRGVGLKLSEHKEGQSTLEYARVRLSTVEYIKRYVILR